mmetsp:Transcript_72358/g.121447  ORF Transcript_72358/g.121447 Transcript_72358/m.121447 type:complete len:99 (-) Transcript_72358:318-614(-)
MWGQEESAEEGYHRDDGDELVCREVQHRKKLGQVKDYMDASKEPSEKLAAKGLYFVDLIRVVVGRTEAAHVPRNTNLHVQIERTSVEKGQQNHNNGQQ